MDYNEHMAAYRRLSILNILNGAPAYTLHEVAIKSGLSANGQATGTDTLRADLQWLHEQGLVMASQPGGVWIASLTARGGDVREGLLSVPGVARPEPI